MIRWKLTLKTITQLSVIVILFLFKNAFALQSEKIPEPTTDTMLIEAKALYECYHYEKAVDKFTQALQLDLQFNRLKNVAAALNYIGEIYYDLCYYNKAITYFDSALIIAKKTAERQLVGVILNNIGRFCFMQGKYEASLMYCDSALTIAKDLKDRSLEGRILFTFAHSCAYSGKIDNSFALIDSALVIAREVKDTKEEARALLALGRFCNFTYEFDKGLLFCDSALIVARRINDLRSESEALGMQGYIYCQLSQYEKALACLDSSLTIDRNTVKKGRVSTYLSLQWAYRALGNCEKALAYCDSALAIARDMKEPRSVSLCWYYYATTYLDFNQFEWALIFLDSAHAIAKEISDTLTIVWTRGSLGESYLQLKQYDKALDYLISALSGARELRDAFLEAGLHTCIGEVYYALEEYDRAIAYFDSALVIATKINVVHFVGWSLNGTASVYFKRGQYDKALAYYDSALGIFKHAKYKGGEAIMLDQLGQTYEKLGDPEKAIDYYKKSIEIKESIRKTLREDELRSAYIKVEKDVYERLVIVLIMLERYEEAFDYLERSQSMKLRKAFEAGDIAAYDPSLRRILERINFLEAEIEGVITRFRNSEIEETMFENTVGALEGKLNQRMLDLQIHHPQLYNIMVPQRRTLKYIQELMPDSTMFVEYVSIGEKYVVLLFSKDIFLVHSIEKSRNSIDSLVLHFLSVLQMRAEKDVIDKECADLYAILIKPLEKDLEKFPNIVVIPYGVLHYLPFHILMRQDEHGSFEYFIEWKRISYLPSASFLTDLLVEKERAEKELLAFGNADGTLPSAEIEVDFIAQIFPNACVYKADSARKERFIELCGEYRLIHLATHGILKTDPRFSYIVLAPPRVGNLTVREILGLSGHFKLTSLVTLSACETATEVDPETAGTELITLANAFKVAGVPTTLASLWEIADRSTAFLMRNFYKNLKSEKISKLEALRQAQITMIGHDQYSHPYHWAAFILIGDWR